MEWLLTFNGVPHVPTLSQLKTGQRHLHASCGVKTEKHTGTLGHTYYTNNLAQLLAQVSGLLHNKVSMHA
jgi:hypothetical protein